MIRNKIRRHTKGSGTAMVFAFVFLTFGKMVTATAEDTYEKFSPVDSWYVYHSVTPEHESYEYTETPRFITDSEIFKPVLMDWSDSLRCEREDGSFVKYKTQLWTEYMYSGVKNTGSWGYTEDSMSADDARCQICGTIRATTKGGHEKTSEYCSTWFEVK